MEQNGLRTFRPDLDTYIACSADTEMEYHNWVSGVLGGTASRALLITGGYGLGKTTLALALCKKLGVDDKDITQINCADSRGIDDARALIDSMYYLPSHGSYRVLILDEIHSSMPLFQKAFLTPIEKMPSKTIIMAATSNPSVLDQAFRSRFYEIVLREYSEEALVDIILGLPQKIKPALAAQIARHARGNPRRAIALTEKAKGAVTEEDIKNVFENELKLMPDVFLSALFSGDANIVYTIAKLVKPDNKDFFYKKILDYLEYAWCVQLQVKVKPYVAPAEVKQLANVISAPASKITGIYKTFVELSYSGSEFFMAAILEQVGKK